MQVIIPQRREQNKTMIFENRMKKISNIENKLQKNGKFFILINNKCLILQQF
jgi:hypothetical protein